MLKLSFTALPQSEMREALSYLLKSLLQCPWSRWAEQVSVSGLLSSPRSAGPEGDAPGHRAEGV